MHDDQVLTEFTQQASTFDTAAVMSAPETLDALIELAPSGGGRWLDAACGTGLVSRALARRVTEVVGVDLTPAMLDQAREAADLAGIGNVSFHTGDATALEVVPGSFDGAVTRFSLHHIPAPGRVIGEMARAVRPGGAIVVGDVITDDDWATATWREEIERLRDPSHWACLTRSRLVALGRAAGLELEAEIVIPFRLDFDEWVRRGTTDPRTAELIDSILAERPGACESFQVTERGSRRVLQLRHWLARWRHRNGRGQARRVNSSSS